MPVTGPWSTLERQGRLRAVVTQNIDELHQRAGSDPELVVELHGTMSRVVCWSCGERAPMEPALDRVRAGDDDPHCRVLRRHPEVGHDQLRPGPRSRRPGPAEEAVADCDLLLAVGSTLTRLPGRRPGAAGPARSGRAVVIVNAQPTPYDELAAAVVRAPISEVLPALV